MEFGLWFMLIVPFMANPSALFHLNNNNNDYDNEPLYLTPYIENGDLEAGRQAAYVIPFYGNITSYSGLFTVNKQYNTNMFFWFFPAEINSDTAPVNLWLQGGPGTSSFYGIFTQHGPYSVDHNKQIHSRKYYWTKKINMIYIDNPIGSGFSYADNEKGYGVNENVISEQLYEALQQFFKLFPMYQKNDFYISGQSYGGKFAAYLGNKIHQVNQQVGGVDLDKKINLKGLTFGNGYCDPINMLNYGDYLYELGIVDWHGKAELDHVRDHMISAIQSNNSNTILFDVLKIFGTFMKLTGTVNYYNYLKDNTDDEIKYRDLENLLNDLEFKRKIHVGNLTNNDGLKVKMFLIFDFMQSVSPLIENLMDNYKMLFYNGQLDVLAAYPLTVKFLESLNWSGTDEYREKTVRNFWYVDKELAGYYKNVRNFTEVLVRNAGHLVPEDQPKWALDLISRFTNTDK